MTFQEYIESLFINNIYKVQILDKKIIESNPSFYQKYASLFAKTHKILEKDLSLLDIAGFLYYKATLLTDNLIDEKDFSKFAQITICQEESIKILTSIFSLENNFWSLWNKRRDEYFEAIYLEKQFSKKDIVSLKEYETLADKKSAFGKVAIDALHSIDNRNNAVYHKLLLSHKYFSIAFQLNDDIQDFKNDLIKGQFNWAAYLLKKEIKSNDDPNILEKQLYIKGIAKVIYKKCINYCNKSLKIVENVNVPEWKNVINETKKSFQIAIIEIENYIETLTSDIILSKKTYIENNLKNGITTAIKFVKSKQNKYGSWRDYLNQGGISDIWTTSFILSKISENTKLKSIFQIEISKALIFIKKNKTNSLWGYNTTWIEDADSTNLVLLSLFFNSEEIETKSITEWLKFQNTNGGFTTYSDKNKLLTSLNDLSVSNIKGWISVHDCVSAVSFYFLANQSPNSDSFIKIKKYFDTKSINEMNSYWWTSEIYTLYYVAKTYYFLGELEKLNNIIDIIIIKQNNNGSFSDKYGENFFYTALSLEIMVLDQRKNIINLIKKSVDFLLINQFIDGSWKNSHALQVPNSKDITPIKMDFPIKTLGMNVRATEFNRLFTTSAILQSLVTYEQKYNPTTF